MRDENKNAEPLTILDFQHPLLQDRRHFIKTFVIGGIAVTLGGMIVPRTWAQDDSKPPEYSMILVDFNKCTGCRTCETACAQYNHKVNLNGETLPGLGNPNLANIRVFSFNPDVDVPVVCVMCKDNPCIEACPVGPDEENRKALYRDPKTLAIKCNMERCIGCGSCARACETQRVGAIVPNPETNKPERMCTLCDGDPQCVKYCPYGALTHIKGNWIDNRHHALSAEKIAEELAIRWYGLQQGGGEEK